VSHRESRVEDEKSVPVCDLDLENALAVLRPSSDFKLVPRKERVQTAQEKLGVTWIGQHNRVERVDDDRGSPTA